MSRDLKILIIALVIWGLGDGVFIYFQPIYLSELGATPVMIGVILAVQGFIAVVTHVLTGFLVDQLGSRPLIWAAFMIGVISTGIMAFATNLAGFSLGVLLYGLTWCLSSPQNSYVTIARNKWDVSRAIAFVSAGFYLGATVGPFLGGEIGDRWGLQAVFKASLIFIFIGLLVVLSLRHQDNFRGIPESFSTQLRHNRAFHFHLGVVFLAAFSAYLPQPLAQNYLREVRGLSLSGIGWVTSLVGVGTVILNLMVGLVKPGLSFFIVQSCVALFALLVWKSDHWVLIALSYFFLGGFKTMRSIVSAMARSFVGADQMGRAYGLTEATVALAMMTAYPLSGILYAYNPNYTFHIGLVMIGISLVVSCTPGLLKQVEEVQSF